MSSVIRFACVLAILSVIHWNSRFSVEANSIEAIREAAKTVANNAADAADKTEPVPETGGVRATALHTGANLIVDKGLDVLGKKYPLVAAAAPTAKKLLRPVLNKVHETINNYNNKDDVEAEAKDVGEAEVDKKKAEVKAEEKPVKEQTKEKKKEEKKEEEEKEEKIEEKQEDEKKDEKKSEKKEKVKEEEVKEENAEEKGQKAEKKNKKSKGKGKN